MQVSSKIDVIKTLLEKADKVIIVGGMVFTFDKAQGKAVGSSLVEDDKVCPSITTKEGVPRSFLEAIMPIQ